MKYLNPYEHYNYKWSCLYWGYNQIWFYDIWRFRCVCKKGYTMEVKTFTLYNENNAFYNLIPYQMSAINWSYYRVSTLLIITLGRLYFSEEIIQESSSSWLKRSPAEISRIIGVLWIFNWKITKYRNSKCGNIRIIEQFVLFI